MSTINRPAPCRQPCGRSSSTVIAKVSPSNSVPTQAVSSKAIPSRPLTSHQFELLVALAGSAGRVLTREQLMERVRGEPLDAFDRSIDVHVGRIRAAIEDDPRHPRRIVTIRGAGYVFPKSQDGA